MKPVFVPQKLASGRMNYPSARSTAEARRHSEETTEGRPPQCDSPVCSHAVRVFGACAVAKRLECAELAPAVEDRMSLKAGASSALSKRFARFSNAPISWVKNLRQSVLLVAHVLTLSLLCVPPS